MRQGEKGKAEKKSRIQAVLITSYVKATSEKKKRKKKKRKNPNPSRLEGCFLAGREKSERPLANSRLRRGVPEVKRGRRLVFESMRDLITAVTWYRDEGVYIRRWRASITLFLALPPLSRSVHRNATAELGTGVKAESQRSFRKRVASEGTALVKIPRRVSSKINARRDISSRETASSLRSAACVVLSGLGCLKRSSAGRSQFINRWRRLDVMYF